MTDYLERARIARSAKLRLVAEWLKDAMEGRRTTSRQPLDTSPFRSLFTESGG